MILQEWYLFYKLIQLERLPNLQNLVANSVVLNQSDQHSDYITKKNAISHKYVKWIEMIEGNLQLLCFILVGHVELAVGGLLMCLSGVNHSTANINSVVNLSQYFLLADGQHEIISWQPRGIGYYHSLGP